jgi:hypothetical protein
MLVLFLAVIIHIHALHLFLSQHGLNASYTLNVSKRITIRKITVYKSKLRNFDDLFNKLNWL